MKKNPLKLNKLQLKTLTLLQELAKSPHTSTLDEETGSVSITSFPDPHGNHFHIGSKVVMASDATGFKNEGVWQSLHRKGLAKATYPVVLILNKEGLAYDTGLYEKILHGSDH